MQQFERDQPLIVIHRYNGIEFPAYRSLEDCVGRVGTRGTNASVLKLVDCRDNKFCLFVPKDSPFARMRIEPANGELGFRDTKPLAQMIMSYLDRLQDQRFIE